MSAGSIPLTNVSKTHFLQQQQFILPYFLLLFFEAQLTSIFWLPFCRRCCIQIWSIKWKFHLEKIGFAAGNFLLHILSNFKWCPIVTSNHFWRKWLQAGFEKKGCKRLLLNLLNRFIYKEKKKNWSFMNFLESQSQGPNDELDFFIFSWALT